MHRFSVCATDATQIQPLTALSHCNILDTVLFEQFLFVHYFIVYMCEMFFLFFLILSIIAVILKIDFLSFLYFSLFIL